MYSPVLEIHYSFSLYHLFSEVLLNFWDIVWGPLHIWRLSSNDSLKTQIYQTKKAALRHLRRLREICAQTSSDIHHFTFSKLCLTIYLASHALLPLYFKDFQENISVFFIQRLEQLTGHNLSARSNHKKPSREIISVSSWIVMEQLDVMTSFFF